MRTPLLTPLAAALLLAGAATAQAVPVQPSHYDMPNGYGTASGGSYNYWDLSYSGLGNPMQDFAPLSGGLGDLTDGVIATQNWIDVENLAGTGPYVGWREIDPVIEFHFAQPQVFLSLSVYHDDADGLGNVAPPSSLEVTLNGQSFSLLVNDDPGALPNVATFVLPALAPASSLTLQLFRRDSGIFISEVQFDALPVPEPHSAALLLAGLGGLAVMSRRRNGAAGAP